MVLYFKLKKYFEANNELANDIINSISYKVGYFVTYPVRFISDVLKGKKTVLFHQNLPDNGFSEKFEQQWVNLINSSNINTNNFNNSLQFDLEGSIDEFNNSFIRGWYRNKTDKHLRLEIQVFQNKKIIGTTVCDKYRIDLKSNNVGDAHYGFYLKFENPIKIIDENISIKIISNNVGYSESVAFNYKDSDFHLEKKESDYKGSFDKIKDGYACGWVINSSDNSDSVTVLLYRNEELVNTGLANLYRNDLRAKIKNNYNRAFRLKIPLVDLLKGGATYKILTADKFEIGRIEWDSNNNDELINQKLNSLKTDLYLPLFDGFTKQQANLNTLTVAIHIHVFYVDVFEEMCQFIKQFNFEYSLFISTPESNLKRIDTCLNQNKLVAKKIVSTPNRGRDVAPFIIEFGVDLLEYEVALHLHTKKTNQNTALGEIWLKHLLQCLVKDDVYVNSVFLIFKYFPNVGIIAPKLLNELLPFYNWGENYKNTTQFLKKLKIDAGLLNENEVEFPAGTMFWFQPKALKKLLTLPISYKDFPKEPIKGDGSFAHVIERSIYYIAESSGFTYQTIAPVNPNLIHNNRANIAISIIIPIYNAEKWLLHSIQSILLQTRFLEPFEILLVDNNSTDKSTPIAKMFSQMYQNIHYHLEPKKGAGNARNLGIQNAKGKYLFFLDADDVLDSNALQNLMDLAYNGISDLITSPLIIFSEKSFNYPEPTHFTTGKINIDMNALKKNTKKIDPTILPYLYALFSDFGPCAKLYKTEFILKNEIKFPVDLNYEDNYFIYNVYLSAAQISICDEPTYLYRKLLEEVGTTQSTSFKEKDLLNQFEVIFMLIDLLKIKQNSVFQAIGHQSIIEKLVWMFNGINKISSTDAFIFSKLSTILFHFSSIDIENFGGKYSGFLKMVKNKNIDKAILKYNKL